MAGLTGISWRLFLWCLTVPELLRGKQLSATVIDLSPWVEYEFRVLATNSIGTGEPSKPSKKARTKEMRTYQKPLTFPFLPTMTQIVCKLCTAGKQWDPVKEFHCISKSCRTHILWMYLNNNKYIDALQGGNVMLSWRKVYLFEILIPVHKEEEENSPYILFSLTLCLIW